MSDDGAALSDAITRAQAGVADYADPATPDALLALLRLLHAVGRRDLPLGRLVEGHVDALQIVSRYGTPAQVEAAQAAARGGATFGVWNADLPGDPLRLGDGRLTGGKSYASGAGVLSHALVTADAAEGRRLLLLDLARVAPTIDRDWWQVVGMARSHTHRVRWQDASVEPDMLIGAPGDYAREPHFSGGALRFVAVHAGGVAALLDHARTHLVAAGRAEDPLQLARVAELFNCADMAAAAVRRAAERWFDAADDARLPQVAAARLQVTQLAERAIAVAQEAVGLQGLFQEHPLATTVTDLMVYLRQPAPDAQRLALGRAVADERVAAAL